MDKSKYKNNELKYLEMVLNSEKWSSTEGNWVYNFEQEFAKKFGAKYAIAANSGTATLHMALVALGVGPGDEVITPALTVIMDTSAIIHAGAIPVYADVTYNFTIDPVEVRKKITKKTKAIIAVSLYGYPCYMDELMQISMDYNIPIIEDNAQNIGHHRAHITSYSFENSKHLSCGEGGIVITDNEEWARKMRMVGNHGFKNSYADSGRIKLNLDVFQDPDYLRHSEVGWNYRMSEFSAAIMLAQLEKIDDIVARRKMIAKSFNDVFVSLAPYFFVTPEYSEKNTYWTFVVRFLGSKEEWKRFHQIYIKNGGDGIYSAWMVPYLEPAIEKMFGYSRGLCKLAEQFQKQIMQFKLNYRDEEIAEQKIEALVKTIKEFDK